MNTQAILAAINAALKAAAAAPNKSDAMGHVSDALTHYRKLDSQAKPVAMAVIQGAILALG